MLHLNDFLPLIKEKPEFTLGVRDGYQFIDYNYVSPETFDHPLLLECRGIKFDREGNLIARPHVKFFNVGERSETQPDSLPWGTPHIITEKLDGSMMHPVKLGDSIRLMTRAGITDHALRCEASWLNHLLRHDIEDFLELGMTPIFEWCSPNNRIVVKYNVDQLYLVAIRDNETGRYLSRGEVNYIGREFLELPTPKLLAADGDWKKLEAATRELQDKEGYVVWFGANGLVVKIKSDWYVQRHRAIDGLRLERNVFQLAISNGLDDIKPMVDEVDRAALEVYELEINRWRQNKVEHLGQFFAMGRDFKDRKTYAEKVMKTFTTGLDRACAFMVYDGGNPTQVFNQACSKLAHKSTSELSIILEELNAPRWEY